MGKPGRLRREDFAGKTVYIPGGSMGIGLAIAKRVAALGAHVALFARWVDALAGAAEQVGAACRSASQRVLHRQLDVADAEQVATVMSETVAQFGPPDVLINCVGRAIPRRFEEVTQAQLVETMQINLYGCWHTISALVPHMRGRGAHVVNTSSLAGLMGVFGYTDYCASKFALIGFSEALRSELKPQGIAVSVLCPPDTDTPGFANENATKPVETQAISAGASLMSADDVAEEFLRGMARGRFLIIPGFQSRMVVRAKRYLPFLVDWITDQTIAKVARGKGQ